MNFIKKTNMSSINRQRKRENAAYTQWKLLSHAAFSLIINTFSHRQEVAVAIGRDKLCGPMNSSIQLAWPINQLSFASWPTFSHNPVQVYESMWRLSLPLSRLPFSRLTQSTNAGLLYLALSEAAVSRPRVIQSAGFPFASGSILKNPSHCL